LKEYSDKNSPNSKTSHPTSRNSFLNGFRLQKSFQKISPLSLKTPFNYGGFSKTLAMTSGWTNLTLTFMTNQKFQQD